MTRTLKRVEASARVSRRSRSAGLSIAQVHGEHLPGHLDPFLAFDHFEMAQPFFPPHPHAGFSAVTYLFPQSANGFVNRDSRGDRVEIHPGDLHWTAAGSGLLHEEVPITRGVVCHGLQIFVNLHSTKKWMRPEVLHLDAAQVPVVRDQGAEVRVVAGSHAGVFSPLAPPTAVTLLDVLLEPGAVLRHQVPAGEQRFVYVLDGAAQAGGEEQVLDKGSAAGFSQEGERIELRSARGAHLVLAGGAPLREPAVFYGPFCMTTQEEIQRAVANFQAGAMGALEPSF
jgi:redox-sensitive bicupin YhaK (pirin superfamily)